MSLWFAAAVAGEEPCPRSKWTADAFACQKGRLREAAAIPVVPSASPKLDEGSLGFFREFAAGELPVDAFQLSTGTWAGIKLTHARGRASNAYHFVLIDPCKARRVAGGRTIVGGIALGEGKAGRDGRTVYETLSYVVPADQERWLLSEFAEGARNTARLAELEVRAYERALVVMIAGDAASAAIR